MKPIWVRPIRPEDQEAFVDWSARNLARNQFDLDILNYRQTVILCAHDGKPLLFMPVQLAIMLESLAPRPESSDLQRAAAIKELIHAIVLLAKSAGMGELYFVSKDQDIIDLAQRHGFEEAPGTVLRLKVDKLEEANENHHQT
jgi:N-acetylglutamate synthase-like GNAT family acetyltransferase